MSAVHPHVIHALLAAALFGASTPLAKVLVGDVPPLMLGGLLYFSIPGSAAAGSTLLFVAACCVILSMYEIGRAHV